MANPITWQNIQGTDLAAASRPLEAAQRSFNGVFDQLGQMLQQREKMGEQNWQNTKANNTAAFLDRLASYGTPEELAAAQKSGALNQFRQQFGSQIDANAIRGAEEQRLGTLRTGQKQAWEFQDISTDRTQAPIKDQIKSLIAAGKFDDVNTLLSQHDLRNESELALGLRNMKQQVKVEGQQDTRFSNDQTTFGNQQTRFGWEGEMHPLELAAKRASIARENASIAESRARVAHMGDERSDRKASLANAKLLAGRGDKQFEELRQNSPYSMGAYGTAEGKKNLYAALKDVPGLDDRDKEDIVYNLDKYYKTGAPIVGPDGKPSRIPLPISAVIQAIEGSTDNPLAIGFSRRGDDVVNKLDARFGVHSGGKPRRDYNNVVDKDLVSGMLDYESQRLKRQLPMDSLPSAGIDLMTADQKAALERLKAAARNKQK